jgi:hypothetical protein
MARDEAGESSRFSGILGREVAVVGGPCWVTQCAECLAVIAAARHVGIEPARGAGSRRNFAESSGVHGDRGAVGGVTVYDDFAHHPTAIETTLADCGHGWGKPESWRCSNRDPTHEAWRASRAAGCRHSGRPLGFLNSPDLGWDLPRGP